jgi:hypothetical protein
MMDADEHEKARREFNRKVQDGEDRAEDWRSELARRIWGVRKVSLQNDPARRYRRDANRCRKGEVSYNRLFGIPKVRKPARG